MTTCQHSTGPRRQSPCRSGGQLIQLLGGVKKPALSREHDPAGLDGHGPFLGGGAELAQLRVQGMTAQVLARPGFGSAVRFMISHCWTIDSVLFQLQ